MIENGRKVLVIGPKYYNFLESVSSAFRTLGWICCTAGYDNPVDPYRFVDKCRYKLSSSGGRKRLERASSERLGSRLKDEFEMVRPDLVFIMNGDGLPSWLLDCFRRSSKVVLWLFDNISKMPGVMPLLSHADRLYSFDMEDVKKLRESGLEADFLAQACDDSIYHPLDMEKDIDILFIGNLYYYPNRQRLLERVVDEFPDRKVLVIGSVKPWYKNPVAWLLRRRRDVYTNSDVTPREANLYYNRARVAINIHREDQKNGANPRVFEICGSGTYQVCDRNPYVESLFPDGEIGLYGNGDELLEEIRDALSGDVSRKARSACAKVAANHSYVSRMSQVLADSGLGM